VVELAAVLEIDPESARALLKSVPVVIKEGISKQQAEHLQDLLRVINALSLMEPTEEIPRTAKDLLEPQPDVQALKQQREEKETLRSYALVGAAVAVSSILVIWLAAAFFSSYSRSSSQNLAKPPIVESESPEPQASPEPQPKAPILSELYQEKESAEFRVQQLEFELQLAEQELRSLYSKYPNDPNSIREKKVEIAGYRERLHAEKAAVKKVKTQVQAIEATLRQSSE
jgi:hypothetical protein